MPIDLSEELSVHTCRTSEPFKAQDGTLMKDELPETRMLAKAGASGNGSEYDAHVFPLSTDTSTSTWVPVARMVKKMRKQHATSDNLGTNVRDLSTILRPTQVNLEIVSTSACSLNMAGCTGELARRIHSGEQLREGKPAATCVPTWTPPSCVYDLDVVRVI